MLASVVLASVSAALVAAAAGSGSGPANQDFMSRHYPPGALAKGEEGQVGFQVDLSDEGRIEQCAITKSSGYATLDRETCDFIVQYMRLGAVRDSEGNKQRATTTGLINWKLPAGVRKSSEPRMVSAALPPPIICKRTKASGSNRAHKTFCMTDDEWRRHDQLTRDQVDQMVGRMFCGDHGC